MKQEENIPTIDLKLTTIEVKSEVRKLRLTRRNTFYKGIIGKIKCLYYWLRFRIEKKKVSLNEWLDEPVAWKIESPTEIVQYSDPILEKELEHYLIDEVAKRRNE